MTWIVGTKPADHDPCFVLLKDGEPQFVYEQERFNRIKYGYSSDLSVLFEGLAEFGVSIEDVSFVSNYLDTRPSVMAERHRLSAVFYGTEREDFAQKVIDLTQARLPMYHHLLKANGIPESKIIDVQHHVCHCASVFYPSGFDNAAIISMDGGGELESGVLAFGNDHKIDVISSIPQPHSLGYFYAGLTYFLGWGYGEEGKSMALAAYGSPKYVSLLREKYFDYDEHDGSFRYLTSYLPFEEIPKLFGLPRQRDEPLTQLHKDVAASVQQLLEEVLLSQARHIKKLTNARNLVVTGGVALNSVANGRLMKERLFDEIVALPQANDAGTALGGALYIHHNILGNSRGHRKWTMRHAYWGRHIDIEAVEREAERLGLQFTKHEDIADVAARLIAGGKIVGWVQGRSEIGPRALGNRSILADPRRAEIKDQINLKVKNREDWRPFAPSVLREDVSVYFEAKQDLPYMIIVADARPEWRDKIPAVLHVDGSARVQTVARDANPLFYSLIEKFKAISGIGMLLNTSFNGRNEPLVQTARQAMNLFLNSEMDALVIGDYLFQAKPEKRPSPSSSLGASVGRLGTHRNVLLISEFGLHPIVAPFAKEAMTNDCSVTLLIADVAEADAALNPKQQESSADSTPIRKVAVARYTPSEAIDPGSHDVVIFAFPQSASDFLFDPAVLNSSTFKLTSQLLARPEAPTVLWLDRCGGLTDPRYPIRAINSFFEHGGNAQSVHFRDAETDPSLNYASQV